MMHKMRGTGFRTFTPEQMQRREANDEARAERAKFTAQLRAAEAIGMRMVYAALRAERPLVKIGTSLRLTGHNGRLRRLEESRLIAVIAGGYDVERQVHDRLASHRVWAELPGYGYGEHFTLCTDVLDWVNETRHAVNLEPLALDMLMSQYGV